MKRKLIVTVKLAFGRYLFATNTISSGVLMFLGDIIHQEFKYQREPNRDSLTGRYNYAQLMRMFITGLAMGPVHHYYYKYLNVLWPQRDMITVTKKVIADQFVMSPICISQFFYTVGLLEGKNIQQCTQEMKDKFISVYTMDWAIWPPTQYINFYLLPVRYQVVYINTVTMVYNVFLSYIKHYDVEIPAR